MARVVAIASTALALIVGGCGPGVPKVQLDSFNSCQSSTDARYPNTAQAGTLSVDAQHIQEVGDAMESCMSGFGYVYDEAKPNCKLPPQYDARFYFLKSNYLCYSSRSK
jgi:hypothetical protein